ncbi:Ribosome assembly protein 4 [Neolecta irregularis DAH-3]|uniref:Ribosome assembly protein 4 n=1 Tax=Neolecta irregularis (strain DAH-3) TaxID=1198029 RepID=A0A1U7LVV0_NEOID|nr:Ribosome assembly protein 4 [Neolecta irregularis DAH-3]|eukprot:OLL26672.1 Ribosome assembly protein 4 [Neolecta irregularis DAH-3]
MATLLPPPPKRARIEAQKPRDIDIPSDPGAVLCRFRASDTGEVIGSTVRLAGNVTVKQLELLVNQLTGTTDDPLQFTFSLAGPDDSPVVDVLENIYTDILQPGYKSTEDLLTLVYTPQAVFRVRAVGRCASSISGHSSEILTAQFGPNGSERLVTGSGDGTARIWDCLTQTPLYTLKGHTNWVLCASWSPDGNIVATGSMDNTVRLWDPKTGKACGEPLKGHVRNIFSLAWEPYHLTKHGSSPRLASGSKDGMIKIWETTIRQCQFTLCGHTSAVSCVKWSGKGLIISSSRDKSIKIWDSKDGKLVHTLTAHSHWVNHIALSTEHVLRLGPFADRRCSSDSGEAPQQRALRVWEKAAQIGGCFEERFVTGSDDFTMFLWDLAKGTKPVARMTGHQKLVNHVSFSPDGRYIASASFDNSVKLWDGRDGKFIATLRGHVAAVYQCAWSSDSRLLVSSSKDTTLKVWDIRTRKLKTDLAGHQDQVYAVDWSVDGELVASGGRDKSVRLWRH